MKRESPASNRLKIHLITLLLVLCWPLVASADDACEPAGDYSFVCGPASAEDLVVIPGTNWIIASDLSGQGPMYLIDAANKSWSALFADGVQPVRHDTETYGACPGAPDSHAFGTHGLSLLPGTDGHSTLYVVGHGGREAIEIFDVDATGQAPQLTWIGCVMTPDGMAANSVASLEDGSLLATIPLLTGVSISEALAGKVTGGVFRWSPGDKGFSAVLGTAMPYANGIEVSADGKSFYVASSGEVDVTAFTNTDPARILGRTETFSFIPDNLHRDANGNLVTAGLEIEDPVCGPVKQSEEFDLEEFASCPRAFTVLAIDPETMQVTTLATGPANPDFSNITMAVTVNGELWIGTFAGDRIAYRPLAQ